MKKPGFDPSGDVAAVELALAKFLSMLDATISEAKDVNTVISALHCLALLLHPNHQQLHSGAFVIGDAPGDHVSCELEQLAAVCRGIAHDAFPGEDPVEIIERTFYGGTSFPTLVKILIYRVNADWLACFPLSVRLVLFDEFFTSAPPCEVLMALVPTLTPGYHVVEEGQVFEMDSVCAVAQRLLVLCLIEKQGLKKMAFDYGMHNTGQDVAVTMPNNLKVLNGQSICSIAQVVASIPDKARLHAPSSMHSPFFYQSATSQLLDAAEDHWRLQIKSPDRKETGVADGTFLFIGEVLAKFCRRGHADVVASQMLPILLQHVKQATGLGRDGEESLDRLANNHFEFIEGPLEESIWPHIAASMKDPHAMERWSEALLLEMAAKCIQDWDAYCILWTLFSSLFTSGQAATRLLFTEKFLLWKVFPICCLRWILHFAVLRFPPRLDVSDSMSRIREKGMQKDVVRHLVEVWAEVGFIQSSQMQQQAYLTAAVGMSLKAMSKDDLENNLLQSLLQGISRRLESPLQLVRQMAKRVALVFSLVINPANPLFLDEDDRMENLSDWEELELDGWGRTKKNVEQGNQGKSLKLEVDDQSSSSEKMQEAKRKKEQKEKIALEAYNPDEIIDLSTYTPDLPSDEETDIDAKSETSLMPYDMSDDESDLDRGKFPMQLRDCAVSLRKGDEPEKVERALEMSERLVRAMPDELENDAPDLAHALIHVRCSAVVVEGQEQSAEDKRHGTLVALLACAPHAVVEVLTKELYSPHVDVSQRLLILEVMLDAARELSNNERQAAQLKTELIGELPAAKWYGPGSSQGPLGSGPWKEVYHPDETWGWAYRYEREIPLRSGQRAVGKSHRWGHRSKELREQQRKQVRAVGFSAKPNRFAPFAAAFMLPVMREYDKEQHGVDLLGRDFLLLGRLLCMLGVCMECVAYQPEAPMLAAALLDMLKSRQIAKHLEPYVRRSALYAASRVIVALHPSYVAGTLSGGDHEIAERLDWIRDWASKIAENDSDTDCSMMAMACLQLHSELALQALRSIESSSQWTDSTGTLVFKIPKGSIVIP